VHIRYKKVVGTWINKESEFYSNGSPNENLESELKKRLSKRLYISFLIVRNRDFCGKYTPTAPLFVYPNIVLFYFGFLTSQK
jgi:hypothetical protein